ncbi:hypothetical protein LCGC14_3146680, partial [marine sediment metagenome]
YKSGLRVFLIEHAAGDLEDLKGAIGFAEEIARRSRCHRMQVDGRAGWLRVFGDEWHEFSRSIEKEIDYG